MQSRAWALSAGYLLSCASESSKRVSIVSGPASVAVLSGSVVSAVEAVARLGVAQFTESITVASDTVGVVPVTGLALVAGASVRARSTAALTRHLVAHVIQRAVSVTITG